MPKAATTRRRSTLKEAQLAEPVLNWLTLQGLCVHREVKLAAKRVDIVGVPHDYSMIDAWTGVELKLYKWKDALAQATANAIVFEHNYVALWHESTGPALSARAKFEEAGIGLISVFQNRIEVLIAPRAQRPLGQVSSKESVRALLPGA